jgi:hypothetical protein
MPRRDETGMKQQARSMTGYFDKGKSTRRERFLAEMEQAVPWSRLLSVIEPHYPKRSAKGGRPPLPLERMLRIYCLQQVVQPLRPGRRGGALRLAHDAPLCRRAQRR